jgi:hypothetical protein
VAVPQPVIVTYPCLVLGGGLPLFDSPRPPESLRLTDSKVWPNGVAQLRYEVAAG